MEFNLFELTIFKSLIKGYLKQYPEAPLRIHELHGKILEGIELMTIQEKKDFII
jgi:hypothetical protein